MRLISFLCVFWGSTVAFGQQGSAGFVKLNQTNGLSNGRVTGIVQDARGLVWIGTKDGLNRYDGLGVKVYSKQNSHLSFNDITDIHLTQSGELLVATFGGGLNVYDTLLDDFVLFKSSPGDSNTLPTNYINRLWEAADGTVWLGTEAGLVERSASGFRTWQPAGQPAGFRVAAMAAMQDVLWVGTFGSGLWRFHLKTREWTRIEAPPTFNIEQVQVLQVCDSVLLIGTAGSGLLSYQPSSGQLANFFTERGMTENIPVVRALLTDSRGQLWVGSDGNGLLNYQSGLNRWKVFRHNFQIPGSLSGNAIYEIFEDKDQHIWVGHAWNGIDIFQSESAVELIYSDVQGQYPFPVLSILEQSHLTYLGLDGNGLTQWNRITGDVRQWNRESGHGLGSFYVQCMLPDPAGGLWLGTFSNGLVHWDPLTGKMRQYDHRPGLAGSLRHNDVRYLLPDGGGFWVATWGGGLHYWDDARQTLRIVKTAADAQWPLSSDNILALQQGDSAIWMATFGGGLCQMQPSGEVRYFRSSETDSLTLATDNLYSLLVDSRGNVWAGTAGEGVNRLDVRTGMVERFADIDMIRQSTVVSMIEDSHGDIWFGTRQGIFRYHYERGTFESYAQLAGEYHINAAWRDAHGRLLFGGQKGVVRFYPSEVQTKPPVPPVVITDFKLFNRKVNIGAYEVLKKQPMHSSHITLAYAQDVLTFEFAALQFPSSANCEFAIRLEPFDPDWRYIGKDRTATYTRLAPGEYTFQVKSKPQEGEWGDSYQSVRLTVLKPWWLQGWAIGMYLVLLLGAFYLFRRYIVAWERLKGNLRMEKFAHEKDTELYQLKQQFFTNISHEIRTPVSLILSAIRKISHQKEVSEAEEVNVLLRNGNHLLHLVNELLDLRKFESEQMHLMVSAHHWEDYCEEVFLSFREMARQRQLEFTFEAKSEATEVWFDGRQMDKVLYNLLSNAFKFTRKGSVEVKVETTSKHACLYVSDTGVGMTPEEQDRVFQRFYQSADGISSGEGFGLGLFIAREIVEAHGGTLEVRGEKGKGSLFTVRLKLGNAHFAVAQIQPVRTPELTPAVLDDWQMKEQTVLVVEDHTEIRRHLAYLLSAHFTVCEAADGEEGLRQALAELPDLILSDVMMPRMDGLSLIRTLRENAQTSHIPVMLLTARATTDQQIAGYDTGADDYVTKPFDDLLLLSKIRSLLQNRKNLHERYKKGEISLADYPKPGELERDFLQKLSKVVKAHLSDGDLHVDFFTRELGMSHSVIYKKVKSITGLTLVEYIRDVKLETARTLLQAGGMSVSEVSYRVGYADTKYFGRLFKQKFDQSPSAFLPERIAR